MDTTEDPTDLKPQSWDTGFQDREIHEAILRLTMQEDRDIPREIKMRRHEVHQYLRSWLRTSMSYRKANYEEKWNRWRRNCRNIYDPAAKARKERWQNSMFVPISMQNKEIIKGQLYRTLISGLPYSLSPRPSGSMDESQDIKTLVLREMERSRFEVASNNFFDDLTIYGTSFMKIFHEIRKAKRSKRVPTFEPPNLEQILQIKETGQGLKPSGFTRLPVEEVVVYKGISAYHVSIWDMFFSNNQRTLQGDSHCQRYWLTLQQIVDGIKEGYFFPEAYAALKDVGEDPKPPEDKQSEWTDLYKSSIRTPKTFMQVPHYCYEWWGLLPKKWLYLREEELNLIDDPEELMPCKAIFSNEALLAVDFNDEYSGESPFLSTGYLMVPNEIYHIGPTEMIEQLQAAMNEDTNQRRDNVQLILNRMGVILERALVSRADLISRPGGMIRIKSNSSDDVSKAFQWADTPDVTQSSYMETQNQERFAQSLSGAQVVAAGGGQIKAKDITQTKGGMQILKQSTQDRFNYYAMVIEADFITQVIKKYYSTIYSHIDPQDIQQILGPERASRFVLRTPEEIENDYHFEPQGVFSTINQPIRISQWQAFRDQFKGAPFFNDIEMAIILGTAIELPELDKVIVPPRDPQTGQILPFQMMQQLSLLAQATSGQHQPPEGGGNAGARGTRTQLQAVKAGKNTPQENPQ